MKDDLLDYDADDLFLMNNPEKAFLKRISQSLHLARVILYCGLKLLKEQEPFVTVPDLSRDLNIARDYGFQLYEILIQQKIIEKRKIQGENRRRYVLKDEKKLRKAVEVARRSL